MKRIILFVVIFILGGISYSVLNPLLSSFLEKESVSVATSTKKTQEPTTIQEVHTTPKVLPEEKKAVVIDAQGGLHDGPFSIKNADGEAVAGSVEIIRSPEETLLQFKGTTFTHNTDAAIYFTTDKTATKYFNIGPAKLNSSVYIYGMPIDIDLSIYKYILIYNTEDKVTEFFVEILN